MWRVLRALNGLQALAGVGAVVAAGIDVESILVSGTCVAAIGLVVARLAFRSGRLWNLVFGLAGPTAVVVVLVWIMFQRWGPHDAQRPVFVLLLWALRVARLGEMR